MLDDAENSGLPIPGQPNGHGRWLMMAAAVEALFVLEETDRAGAFYPLIVECIDRTQAICVGWHDSRLLQRTAGIAATASHRWEEAETHFLTALRQAESLPHRPELAHTRRFYGQMLRDRNGPGDRKQAEDILRQAAEDYDGIGMSWHRELAASLVP
jgi:hypothetical protein